MVERSLEEQLRDLGAHLDTGPSPEVATAVLRRLQDEPAPLVVRARRRLARLFTALLAAVLAAGLLAVPAVRAAVVDLITLPGVVFDRDTPQPRQPAGAAPTGPLGGAYELERPVSLAEARRVAGRRTLVPDRFGPPDEVYVAGTGSAQMVHLLWKAQRPELPELPGSAAGLYIMVFGNEAEARLQKMIFGVRTEEVRVDGRPGVWIGSPHATMLFGQDGLPDYSTRRAAGPALLVDYGGYTVRIEARVTKEDAVDLAESLR